MITEYGVLKPDVPRSSRPGDAVHEEWRKEWQEKYPDWKPLSPEYNIRFVHDPLWQSRLFSIQCIQDAVGDDGTFDSAKWTHWFWGIIGGLFMTGSMMLWGLRLSR